MAGNNGGPWGGGGGSGGGGGNRGGDDGNRGGGRRPGQGGDGQQIPEIDEIVRKGQEQLRVLMGGRGGKGRGNGTGGGDGPRLTPGSAAIGVLALIGLWLYASFYTVRPEEQSVELFLGEFSSIGESGLNFAPWPLVTAEVIAVTSERSEPIGTARSGTSDAGLMLTTDENIVDIDFEVVWNINDPALFLFNLRDPDATVRAVSESAMREVIAASQLAPILNRDREIIADTVRELIQSTLDSYESGINIVRLNLDRADPPNEVIDAFRDVQAAEQERDQLERRADAYANQVLAGARGEAAQVLEQAEGYRAQVVNEAEGEASRFLAVLNEYREAPDVTRRRLYLETMERVLGDVDLVILDSQGEGGGNGVVPYLPLNELRRAPGTASTTGSSN
ncbi:FtsH protease activity modulator HflK [Roseobacter sp. HKCCD9010]|uniref:FtsH protease activity modulator HflK n=1 Tax=Rhodobacterales TaxID=204455 RepID=UPI001490ED87|nr:MULTISPECIES: FtsH protease activity modulator HflK [Rhodobacterales]MBF9051349.1 FtsH protease activity modulator HflK [Rhodobacterales bacterium HKCCD4356]NNV13396.1 FtsH protease activity modulator HflK [Roseobacter sp. HKCCD7357]NNV17647.1 FtsH protease activity modulator HflK [Roseobacter sp. HKCCD8768]NNV27253.1 FtsH protease activity modulator HflK [Roseobacter sp. HKCCD8192]NNV31373.1 FtsH protease activity modulator HflK [Roseobacter sp. HKCCD9061]